MRFEIAEYRRLLALKQDWRPRCDAYIAIHAEDIIQRLEAGERLASGLEAWRDKSKHVLKIEPVDSLLATYRSSEQGASREPSRR